MKTMTLSELAPSTQRDIATDTSLCAGHVSRRFGGVAAVSDVSLELRPGEVHGLIGPNGSGKTTLLNLLSGYYAIDTGYIRIGLEDVSRSDVRLRVLKGVARTFQKPRLLGSLTVLDNAMLGGWRSARSGFVETALSLPRPLREERFIQSHARALLEALGLGYAVGRPARLLEHAEQRFLEIARALMTRPRVLLLDEPAGGLTQAEIESLQVAIGAIARTGIGVLLVEHHTDFVFQVCDRVTVLDLGKTIAHGLPGEIRSHADVVRVYLGS